MEPGTFKDRLLLEGDPHQLIEGMILSAYAIGANVAYVFLRDEYRLAAETLRRAIAEATDRGFLGEHILGSEISLSLHLHTSAGRYICGEETALISALEGRRAIPRTKPPFPQLVGLWGKPTVVNNVETLCNVPHIVNNGAEWFRSLGLTSDSGTKLYGASGKVTVKPRKSEDFAFRFGDRNWRVAVPPFSGRGWFAFHGRGGWGDMELVPLTEELGRYFGTDKGLLVVRAPEDDDLKLKDGDVIQRIDGREPQSVAHAMHRRRSSSSTGSPRWPSSACRTSGSARPSPPRSCGCPAAI